MISLSLSAVQIVSGMNRRTDERVEGASGKIACQRHQSRGALQGCQLGPRPMLTPDVARRENRGIYTQTIVMSTAVHDAKTRRLAFWVLMQRSSTCDVECSLHPS